MKNFYLKPKFFSVLPSLTPRQALSDVIAGIIVAVIALPLSIALALASGVEPACGVYTAIFAGFIVALLGGSRVQIAGMVHALVLLLVLLFLMPLAGLIPMPTIAAILFMVAFNMSEYKKFIRLARTVPRGVRVYEISGPLFFGAADKMLDIRTEDTTRCLILRMRAVTAVDATAMASLEALEARCRESGVALILSHVAEQPMHAMRKSGLAERIGEENFCSHIDEALARAEGVVKTEVRA